MSSSFSVSFNNACNRSHDQPSSMICLEVFGADSSAAVIPMGPAYPLLSRIGNFLVGLKERPYVDGLAAPEMPVYGPVESKLQRPPIERAARES